jgi:hypothetical protein
MQMQSLFDGGRMEIELPSREEIGASLQPPLEKGQTRLDD